MDGSGLLALAVTLGGATLPAAAAPPQNFIFFNRDRHRIQEASFLNAPGVAGAQLKYTWRELEPERDRYELRPLLEDLRFLEKHGKRLFVQLQDVSFDESVNVPEYLLRDPVFGGGAARKYEAEGKDESKAQAFYEGILGLKLVADDGFALVFDAGGTTLRVSRVTNLVVAPYTVLGWKVADIAAAVRGLGERGVNFERFEGFGQDEDGVCTFPDGTKVAWFKDPDDNTLSLTQPAPRP